MDLFHPHELDSEIDLTLSRLSGDSETLVTDTVSVPVRLSGLDLFVRTSKDFLQSGERITQTSSVPSRFIFRYKLDDILSVSRDIPVIRSRPGTV